MEVYSKLAITDGQQEYSEVINEFPINYIYIAGGVSFAGTTPYTFGIGQ